MLRTYLLKGVILLWSIFLLIIEIIGYEPYIEIINIFLGTILAGLTSYDCLTNNNEINLYSAIIGLINIVLGLIFIILDFSLIHATIILVIGGQLIGISIAKTLKQQRSTYSASSTKRPEPIGPEPGPEPRPF
jgi:hypothetical protein